MSERLFVKDMLGYLPAYVVPGIVGFISIPIITRLFSPENYGNYSLVLPVVAILGTIYDWVTLSINRYYSIYEKGNRLENFYGVLVIIGTSSLAIESIIFLALMRGIKGWITIGLYEIVILGTGVFVSNGLFNTLLMLLRMNRKVWWYSIFSVWRSIVSFLAALFLIYKLGLNIEALLWGTIVSSVMAIPLLWSKTIINLKFNEFKSSWKMVREMAVFSFPLVIGNIAAWLLSVGDRYILGLYRGSMEVGIYSASYHISDKTIMLVITLFGVASGPISYYMWENEGLERCKKFCSKIARYYLLICIPLVIGFSVACKEIMSLMAGAKYFEGYRVIPFVLTGVFFFGIQQIYIPGFTYYKKTRFIPLAVFIAGFINVFLNIIYVPVYGYMAAAIITTLSYIVLTVLMINGSRQYFRWRFPLFSLARILSASIIMGFTIFGINRWFEEWGTAKLIVSFTMGGIVYISSLFILGEVEVEEKRIVGRLLSGIVNPYAKLRKGVEIKGRSK